MATFLVDFENVNSSGLTGITDLAENDSVFIFYTPNAATLSFDAHKMLIETKATIKYINVAAGTKNALDFQLGSFLGYLIALHESRDFFIVSADNGFQAVKSFWKKSMNFSDIEIKLIPNIKNAVSAKSVTPPKEKKLVESPDKTADEPDILSETVRIKEIFSTERISNKNIRSIIQLVQSSSDKQHFYTSMTKKFGMEEGLKYYKALRPEYVNIRKLSKEAIDSISN